MARTTIRWVRRAAVVAATGAVICRLLAPDRRTRPPGSETVPVIGGDTWPPVPTNPDRQD